MKIYYKKQEQREFARIQAEHKEKIDSINAKLKKCKEGTPEADALTGELWQAFIDFKAEQREAFRNVASRLLESVGSTQEAFLQARNVAAFLVDYVRKMAKNPQDEIGSGEWFPDYDGLLDYGDDIITVNVDVATPAIVDCLTPFWERIENEQINEIKGFIISEIKSIRETSAPQKLLTKELVQEAEKITITKRPTNGIMATDKGTGALFGTWGEQVAFNGTDYPVKTRQRGTGQEVTAIISADFTQLQGVEISRQLSAFDMVVFNTVCGLFLDGQSTFTTANVIRRATNNYKLNPSQKQLDEWDDAIIKMARCFVNYDATEEARLYGKLKAATYRGYLLPIESIEVDTVNGTKTTKVRAYKVLKAPIMLAVAQSKKQLSTYDIKLLSTELGNTQDVIILKDYLLRRILVAGNNNNRMSNTILYSAIFEYMKIPNDKKSATMNKKAKIRAQADTLLTEWKTAGFISGYTVNKKGREFYSITIKK